MPRWCCRIGSRRCPRRPCSRLGRTGWSIPCKMSPVWPLPPPCSGSWGRGGTRAPPLSRIRHSRRLGNRAVTLSLERNAGNAGTDRDNFPGNLESGNVGGAGRRRIAALALHDIGPVDAGRGNAHQHFALSGFGRGPPGRISIAPGRRALRSLRSRSFQRALFDMGWESSVSLRLPLIVPQSTAPFGRRMRRRGAGGACAYKGRGTMVRRNRVSP